MTTWIDPTVDYTVEVAFGDDPWAISPSWTDLSSRVMNISTRRGSTSEDTVIAPGSLYVLFKNGDRHLDPEYAPGPYYGDIRPMNRIRVTTTYAAVTYMVFQGWVTGWRQDWGPTFGTAVADVVDGGRFFQSEILAGSAYEAAVLADSPMHYWVADGDVGMLRDRVGSIDLGTSRGSTFTDSTFGATALDATTQDRTYPLGQADAIWTASQSSEAVSALPRTVEAWVYVAADVTNPFLFGAIEPVGGDVAQFGIYPTGSTTPGELVVTFDDPANNARFSLATSTGIRLAPGMHHVVAVASSTTLTVYVDGQSAYSGAMGSGTVAYAGDPTRVVIRAGNDGTTEDLPMVNHVAFYSTELDADRVSAHFIAGLTAYGHPFGEEGGIRIGRMLDEIEYPDELRDIANGGTVQGPYLPAGRAALDAIYEVMASETGLVFWSVDGKFTFRDRQWQIKDANSGVVFSDDGNDVGYTDGSPNGVTIDTVRNIVTCSYSDVGAITRRDQTSIDAYGPSREFVDAPTIRNGTDASNRAAYELRLRKDPAPVIPRLTVHLRRDIATNLPAVLGLELGDVVTVERTPMGVGSQIVKRYQVRAIEHDITPASWTTSFYLSPAVPMYDEVPYFVVGHATYGRVGTSAGNAIPF
jgi:hypothetical protein